MVPTSTPTAARRAPKRWTGFGVELGKYGRSAGAWGVLRGGRPGAAAVRPTRRNPGSPWQRPGHSCGSHARRPALPAARTLRAAVGRRAVHHLGDTSWDSIMAYYAAALARTGRPTRGTRRILAWPLPATTPRCEATGSARWRSHWIWEMPAPSGAHRVRARRRPVAGGVKSCRFYLRRAAWPRRGRGPWCRAGA